MIQKRKAACLRFVKSSMLISAIVFILISFKPEPTYAARDIYPKAFKSFKVGTINLTKLINKYSYINNDWFHNEGLPEIYIKNFKLKGRTKKGSRIRYKVKKGYKVTVRLYDRTGKYRKLKNGSKINYWSKYKVLSVTVKKGKRMGEVLLYNFADETSEGDY